MSELDPCPFCGNANDFGRSYSSTDRFGLRDTPHGRATKPCVQVVCGKCGAYGPQALEAGREAPTIAWNRRFTPAPGATGSEGKE